MRIRIARWLHLFAYYLAGRPQWPAGGRLIGPPAPNEDRVGPFKLSEGGPVASLDAPTRGDVIRIEIPGEPPTYRRVLYTRRTGEDTTICGFGPLEP